MPSVERVSPDAKVKSEKKKKKQHRSEKENNVESLVLKESSDKVKKEKTSQKKEVDSSSNSVSKKLKSKKNVEGAVMPDKAKKEKKSKRKEIDSTNNFVSKKVKSFNNVDDKKDSKKTKSIEKYAKSSFTAAQAAEYRKTHSITIGDKSSQEDFMPLATFSDSGLANDILSCTSTFHSPTPIQAQCWPILLSGRDCVGIAETGSGKTLAFSLPGLAHTRSKRPLGKSVNSRGPIVLVVSPTRELAMQSAAVHADAGQRCGQRTVCIYGGGNRSEQTAELEKGAHAIVATPGRLLGYMREGVISLSRVSYLVLDEADRMLDLGFEPDIRAIVEAIGTPADQRQTVMFSATWPPEIQKLAGEFLRDPVQVTIGSDELCASANVTQIVQVLDPFKRDDRLQELLRKYHDGSNRVIIFVLYKKEAIRVETMLRRKGWNCTALHGDKSQTERTSSLAEFKSGKVPLLIATDVAARGLDIPKVEYVINYSFPLTIEDYIHRIGRTGRAGNKGIAHTFFTINDKSHSGELINVLNEAGVDVPEDLMKFGAGVKKKQHALYGNHFRADTTPMPASKHVKF